LIHKLNAELRFLNSKLLENSKTAEVKIEVLPLSLPAKAPPK